MTSLIPHFVDVHVGSQVRSKRLLKGMSQQEVGYALGVTFQQLQKYEKGKNRLSASKLYEASLTLQTPVAHFFYGLPNQDIPDVGDIQFLHGTLSKEIIKILRLLEDIHDPVIKSKLISLIASIAKK